MKSEAVVKKIAAERIERLFELAEQAKDPELARRYLYMLKQIHTHYKVPIPKYLDNRICRGCGTVLVPGKNVMIRVASSKRYVIYKCNNCGKERHLNY